MLNANSSKNGTTKDFKFDVHVPKDSTDILLLFISHKMQWAHEHTCKLQWTCRINCTVLWCFCRRSRSRRRRLDNVRFCDSCQATI